MNYYYDFEFLEGTQDKRFLGIKYGKTLPTIQPISVGIVSDDNREYYAISKDFNLKEAWNRFDLKYNKGCGDANNLPPTKVYWIRENVLKPIMVELQVQYNKDTGKTLDGWGFKNFKYLINKYGKSNKQIADEVKDFCSPSRDFEVLDPITIKFLESRNPIFYGYYSAYDHVALCWLFGKMMDLPKRFPYYTKDIQQIIDEKQLIMGNQDLKAFVNYPKQTNEHNSLSDAKFNLKLYKFLQTI